MVRCWISLKYVAKKNCLLRTFPFNKIASMILLKISLISILALLQNLSRFKFWSKMIGRPIFKLKLCDGGSGHFNDFNNAMA